MGLGSKSVLLTAVGLLLVPAAGLSQAAPETTAPAANVSQLEAANAAYNRGDFAAAFRMFEPLAEQGGAAAQYNLGWMYAQGQGVAQDYAAAVTWYRRAAEQGGADAQNNLGAMYAQGQGVAQDYVQAHKWFNLTARGGDENAVKNRDIAAARMTPAQIAEAQKLAAAWRAK